MPGVFLLNPDRYMTRLMCVVPGVQFAWTIPYLKESKLDPDAWKASMGQSGTRHLTVTKKSLRGVVNPPFSHSVWLNRNGQAIFDPTTISSPGQVMTPAGFQHRVHGLDLKPWIEPFSCPLPYSASDMFRYRFNTLSILYAANHLDLDVNPKPLVGGSIQHRSLGIRPKDSDYQVTCDTCVINYKCDYAREGSVCILPRSDVGVFAKLIGSRNTEDILTGLRLMVVRNGERLEQAIDAELPGEPTKEVTGLMNSVFNQAIQLAKLQDPTLRASPKIQIGINSGPGSSVTVDGNTQPDSNAIATALKELTDYGVPIDEIDEKRLIAYMAARSSGNMREIEAVVNPGLVIDSNASTF